jgi:CHAT domain-containing protein
MNDRHMVVVHDAPSSRIPWETLYIPAPGSARARKANGAGTGGAWAPALTHGLSRRYLAANLSIAKWLEGRREDAFLDVLLVVDPTETLPGAIEETTRLRAALGNASAVRLTEIRGPAGTRAELLRQFTSGKYDIVHFAGHAYFDARHPSNSGIKCTNDEVLSGADLAQIGNLPSLVFFNACEAARVRRGGAKPDKEATMIKRISRNTSFAEAFLRGGVANYIGTYWPVGDRGASLFAQKFYGELLAGQTIAGALLAGRRALSDTSELDWADYVHYGSPDFVVKTGGTAGPRGPA